MRRKKKKKKPKSTPQQIQTQQFLAKTSIPLQNHPPCSRERPGPQPTNSPTQPSCWRKPPPSLVLSAACSPVLPEGSPRRWLGRQRQAGGCFVHWHMWNPSWNSTVSDHADCKRQSLGPKRNSKELGYQNSTCGMTSTVASGVTSTVYLNNREHAQRQCWQDHFQQYGAHLELQQLKAS